MTDSGEYNNLDSGMKLARGFCDLNISATDTDLKKTVLKALSIGYQTVAINREVTDSCQHQSGKKRKKGEAACTLLVPCGDMLLSTQHISDILVVS